MTLNFVSVKIIFSDQSFIVTVSRSIYCYLFIIYLLYLLQLSNLLFVNLAFIPFCCTIVGKQRRSGKRFSFTIYLPLICL